MNLLDLRNLYKKEGVLYSFNGVISQELVTSIGEKIEEVLLLEGTEIKVVHSLFAILTEQMQNMMSYANDRVEKRDNIFEGSGLMVIGFDQNKDKYFVSSANMMESSNKEVLENKLDKINTLDQVQLKKYYKELRSSGREKHSRGAGLGFLEMAKKSSEPLDFKIHKVEEQKSYFEIKVYI